MFARKLHVSLVTARSEAAGQMRPLADRGGSPRRECPLKYLDSFAMRSFTGESRFDDTLPVEDGWLEAGWRVPLEELRGAMQDWFRRKSYLQPGEIVVIEEASGPNDQQTHG